MITKIIIKQTEDLDRETAGNPFIKFCERVRASNFGLPT
jgi:hypothetical protein